MRYNAGSEVYTQGLCQALADRHEVHVFTRQENAFLPEYSMQRAAYPLMFDPVALMQQQAERDTRALVKAATEQPRQEPRLELPSGRPRKVLTPEIAAMVKDDFNAGFTKSAIVRKYRRYCRFSRTYLSDIINDGRLDQMAKTPT